MRESEKAADVSQNRSRQWFLPGYVLGSLAESLFKKNVFPPFLFIENTRKESSNKILRAPFWPHQIWFPILMIICWALFLLLPNKPDLISINQVFHHDLNHPSRQFGGFRQTWYFHRRLKTFSCILTSLTLGNPVSITGGTVSLWCSGKDMSLSSAWLQVIF